MLCALLALSGEEGLGELGGLSLEKLKVRMRRAHSHSLPKTTRQKGAARGSQALLPGNKRQGQEEMASSCTFGAGLDWILRKMSAWKGWSGTGTDFPGKWLSCYPWKCSKTRGYG